MGELTDLEVEKLKAEIAEELADERYKKRAHYKRATYAQGCRGPMCRKAERDRDRERYATRQRIEGKLVRQYNRKLSRYEQVLNAAITAHIWDRECKRLGVTVDNS